MIRIREIYGYVKTFTCIGIPRNTNDSWFRYKTFITFLTFRFSTRGERDTIFIMLTVPSDPTTRRNPVVHNWTGLPQVQKSIHFVQPWISTNCFFQEYWSIPAYRFWAWRHSHPQSCFLSRVFIMTSVIVTSSPREREHLRSMCAPTRALSRIVLSLTKPKDNI